MKIHCPAILPSFSNSYTDLHGGEYLGRMGKKTVHYLLNIQ